MSEQQKTTEVVSPAPVVSEESRLIDSLKSVIEKTVTEQMHEYDENVEAMVADKLEDALEGRDDSDKPDEDRVNELIDDRINDFIDEDRANEIAAEVVDDNSNGYVTEDAIEDFVTRDDVEEIVKEAVAEKNASGDYACDTATKLCADDLFIKSVAEEVVKKLVVLVNAQVKVA